MAIAGGWTIDELVGRVAAVLTEADYPGAPNGRVRDLPDRRAIRWYATIGLLDRPSGSRGRTARYGPRHLMQLVAIKRLQAQGRSLAEIQAVLIGATDATLGHVSGVPDQVLATAHRGTPEPVQPPGSVRAPESVRVPGSGRPPEAATQGATVPRPRFWTAPVPATDPTSPVGHATPVPAAAPAGATGRTRAAGTDGHPPLLYGVPLGGGATLLLPATPDTADLSAIRAAARPLLDLLASHGLLTTPPEGVPDDRPAR